MPNTPRQSKNFEVFLNEIDGKLIKAMFDVQLEDKKPMLPESIVSSVSDEKRKDVLTAIDKMEVAEYIEKSFRRGGDLGLQLVFRGYLLTKKGRHWFHNNSD